MFEEISYCFLAKSSNSTFLPEERFHISRKNLSKHQYKINWNFTFAKGYSYLTKTNFSCSNVLIHSVMPIRQIRAVFSTQSNKTVKN